MKSLEWIFIPLTLLLSVIIFSASLHFYFFQDDWFVLNWVESQNFLSFFNFRTDIIYWRPLSMPILFFMAHKLFSLNAFAFHLVSFGLFSILTLTIYKLTMAIFNDKKIALISAMLYATSPIHFISLSWFSTTSYIVGPIFEALSIISFISFSKNKNISFYALSILFFLLGIASSEFALVLPFVIITYCFFYGKKINYKLFLPFFTVNIAYLILRFIIFPIPAKGDYALSLDLAQVNNFVWYLIWSLGIPERFKVLIFPGLPDQSIKILTQFWQITAPFALFVFLAFFNISKLFKNTKLLFFSLVWFCVNLLPVIFLSNHSYPVYLSFAGLGIIFVLANLIGRYKYPYLIFAVLLWLIVSFESVRFTGNSHWIANEQAMSKAYVDYAVKLVKDPPSNSIFIFKPANLAFSKTHNFLIVEGEDTLKLSLSDQSAMQVIYKDQSIKSLYPVDQQTAKDNKNEHFFEISPRE